MRVIPENELPAFYGNGPYLYEHWINLDPGQVLELDRSEWKLKSHPTTYYNSIKEKRVKAKCKSGKIYIVRQKDN